MMDAYLSIAKGLEDNLYLLQSEKVKAFLIEQLKDKKWLSGHANFLRPLIMVNDRNLINDIVGSKFCKYFPDGGRGKNENSGISEGDGTVSE